MSAVGSPHLPESMAHLMLRSTTPASHEKGSSALVHLVCSRLTTSLDVVLVYLEELQRNPPEDPSVNGGSRAPSRAGSQKPTRSQVSGKARSHATRSQLSRASRDPGAETIGEVDEEGNVQDLRSDVQEQSEVPRTVQIEESMGPGNVSASSLFPSTHYIQRLDRRKYSSADVQQDPDDMYGPEPVIRGKYESYQTRGTIESFGNKGPLPGTETQTVPIWQGTNGQVCFGS
jgi:hypothetical protein